MQEKSLSIYIHYPFCKSKCPYCDFNSHVRESVDNASFMNAYEREISYFAPLLKNRKVKTIFFGGGTPSLMPIDLVESILNNISKNWNIDKNCEITLETNPTSFESKKFFDFRKSGINRLSVGVQALNDNDLKFLGREHSASEAIDTIENAAKIFDNFSFDLIYARPNQSINSWRDELNQALKFNTKHLSLYQLTIEKGTKFFSLHKEKKFEMPHEELSAQFYEITNEIMTGAGFEHYEISNYAKTNFESRHNLVYWQGKDYLGIGAGAHSRIFLDGENLRSSIMMIHEPSAWLTRVAEKGSGIQTQTKISASELVEELILMGLRLKDGLNSKNFFEITEKKFEEVFDYEKLRKLESQGLINIGESIKICEDKRILCNAIIVKVCECMK